MPQYVAVCTTQLQTPTNQTVICLNGGWKVVDLENKSYLGEPQDWIPVLLAIFGIWVAAFGFRSLRQFIWR